MILKWVLLTGALAILFKLCCDSLVDIFLSASRSSVVKMEGKKNSRQSYEDLLIAWAVTGQQLHNEKLVMGNIKERNDLQLIGAQAFFRHGARTPLVLLPSLEEVFLEIQKRLTVY
jgi:hypothetical protein